MVLKNHAINDFMAILSNLNLQLILICLLFMQTLYPFDLTRDWKRVGASSIATTAGLILSGMAIMRIKEEDKIRTEYWAERKQLGKMNTQLTDDYQIKEYGNTIERTYTLTCQHPSDLSEEERDNITRQWKKVASLHERYHDTQTLPALLCGAWFCFYIASAIYNRTILGHIL